MANITGVSKYFTKAAENTAPMTLASSIAAGATTVPITGSSTNYNDGDIVAFVIEPTSSTNKQVFTGQMLGGSATNVVWTYGTNVPHTAGVAIVDYVTATDWDMLTTGVQKSINQDGTLKTAAVQSALNTSMTSSPDWNILGTAPVITASNGSRWFSLKYPSVNYTDRLQLGQNLKIARSTTAPTQSMLFVAASSQYATKASPTGINITGNTFTVEFQVYVNSFNPSQSMVVSRCDSSAQNGFYVQIYQDGRVAGAYASGANTTGWATTQSIPLKRWVHIAFVVSSISGKTGAIYVDGVNMQLSTASAAATTIGNSGNLTLARYDNPGQYSDVALQEVRFWSTAQTQTQILNNMYISLTGTETGLLGLWQGNGNFNDKTANGNHLASANGAIASNPQNAYNQTEFAKILSVSTSGSDTLVDVYTPAGYGIPNETLSSSSYSSAALAFGLPTNPTTWTVSAFSGTGPTTLLNKLVAAGVPRPMENLLFKNLDTAGGTYALTVHGMRRIADFITGSCTSPPGSTSFGVTFPANYITNCTSLVYNDIQGTTSINGNAVLGNGMYNSSTGNFSFYVSNNAGSGNVGGTMGGQIAGY